MAKLLQVTQLAHARGGRELFRDLNFTVNSGEAIQIRGKNGSGKSTLVSLIAGDFPPDEGEISFDGRTHHTLHQLSAIRGVLPQILEIDFPIKVREFIRLGNKGSEILSPIEKLNLGEILEKKVTELSQGQLQRVFFAQLLVQNPELFILDEPFSSQDTENTALFIELLIELKHNMKALVIINHIDIDVQNLIDREIVIG